MWLSAINRDLPKFKNTTLSATGDNVQGQSAVDVGLAKVDRLEEGQYVVMDDNDNEFMLFHPDVDVSTIEVPGHLASWQDPTTNNWMWAVATNVGNSTFQLKGEHFVEPEPH